MSNQNIFKNLNLLFRKFFVRIASHYWFLHNLCSKLYHNCTYSHTLSDLNSSTNSSMTIFERLVLSLSDFLLSMSLSLELNVSFSKLRLVCNDSDFEHFETRASFEYIICKYNRTDNFEHIRYRIRVWEKYEKLGLSLSASMSYLLILKYMVSWYRFQLTVNE